jgi:hypothetical protein
MGFSKHKVGYIWNIFGIDFLGKICLELYKKIEFSALLMILIEFQHDLCLVI